MRATEILTAEHELILNVLASLHQAQKKLERGERPPVALLEKAVTFARNFADRFHHFKEEYLMFGLLAQKKAGRFDLQMGALRYGHEKCRGYIEEITEALEDYAEQDEMATITVIGSMAAYTAVLRNHIHREDQVFFPMVEEALSTDEKEMLMAQFHSETSEKDTATLQIYQGLAREIATLLDGE